MAIAFDTASFWSWSNWRTHNLSHTCTWSNLILWYSCLLIWTSDVLTWVKYNWVAMTRAWYVWAAWERIYLYYLINPATWANTITATTSSSVAIYPESASYTWVKQSWQPDAITNTAYAIQTPMSTSVTTILDNCWLVWVFRSETSQTAVAGTTLRAWVDTTIQIWDSNWAKTPTWSYSLWTTFYGGLGAQIVASFSPSVDTTTNSWFFMFM